MSSENKDLLKVFNSKDICFVKEVTGTKQEWMVFTIRSFQDSIIKTGE